MATVVYYSMSRLVTDYVMGASGTEIPPSAWTMGLASNPIGSGAGITRASIWSVTVSGSNVNELGSSAANGYGRQTIAKSIATGSTDWGTNSPDITFATGGQSTAADQVTFTFTGAPSPNGANSWQLTETGTINTGDLWFGADTAATRTFANGDTEKVIATLKAG